MSATHPAVVTVGVGQPLEIHQVPTIAPEANEVRIRVEWTVSTPLDLHQADGGLLVNPPHILGSSVAGTVLEVGPDTTRLRPGDRVFGYTFRQKKERAHQLYVTTPETMLGKLSATGGFDIRQAVVTCNNFVSAWHTLTHDFGFEFPWPKPSGFVPRELNDWILIWGGGTSVGQYCLQLLKWYGYKKVLVTASKHHHEKLRRYGARQCFDYREGGTAQRILEAVQSVITGDTPVVPFILDCVGSQQKSLLPIAVIAQSRAIVAVMLPVIVRDAAVDVTPEYLMDVEKAVTWQDGVKAVGVRTHFYQKNEFLAQNLQSVVMPEALAFGTIEPNEYLEVGGANLLERATNALSKLRSKEVSGARLIWRVAEPET
ncbi:hypothetical protein LTR84_001536 [Exophiala bonariae]|uniref:Enoyl reductase (ER) domain-containing protein n=1 Tax=Exophiala bonariae TaxID=1690606 RepID=A0AAV9NE24_9EURO|nr:hypothetical protein LTR84_001536 [Exophiala bonariae]